MRINTAQSRKLVQHGSRRHRRRRHPLPSLLDTPRPLPPRCVLTCCRLDGKRPRRQRRSSAASLPQGKQSSSEHVWGVLLYWGTALDRAAYFWQLRTPMERLALRCTEAKERSAETGWKWAVRSNRKWRSGWRDCLQSRPSLESPPNMMSTLAIATSFHCAPELLKNTLSYFTYACVSLPSEESRKPSN